MIFFSYVDIVRQGSVYIFLNALVFFPSARSHTHTFAAQISSGFFRQYASGQNIFFSKLGYFHIFHNSYVCMVGYQVIIVVREYNQVVYNIEKKIHAYRQSANFFSTVQNKNIYIRFLFDSNRNSLLPSCCCVYIRLLYIVGM